MVRLLAAVSMLGIPGCATLEPELFRMPDFGERFVLTVHGTAGPDEAKVIVYQDPAIDERIKFVVSAGVEEGEGTEFGRTFAGAFSLRSLAPGQYSMFASRAWWDENLPAGDSLFSRLRYGEPPSDEGIGTIGGEGASLRVTLAPGTVTYLKLTRSISSELVSCGETAEAVSLCRRNRIATAFERVPPDTARAELAGLRETLYD